VIRHSREERAIVNILERFSVITGVSFLELALIGGLLAVIVLQYFRSRQLAARLAENADCFREFTHASTDWIWETDADHRFTRFLGRPRDIEEGLERSKIGYTRWEFVNADMNDPRWAEHKRGMDSREPIENFEYAVLDKRGNKRWFSINGAPRFDDNGRFTGYRGTASDITHRKQIETAQATRARQQQCVAILSQVALAGVPLDELFKVASQSIARTLGVELVGVVDFAEDNSTLRLRSGYGWREDLYGSPVHTGAMARYTLEQTEPVWTRDFADETRFTLSARGREHGIVSGISVVIGDRTRRYGVLQAFATHPRDFDEHDASFFQAVAFVIAAAIERDAAEASLRLRQRALNQRG
jgi:PAS domain S-box-containing protein